MRKRQVIELAAEYVKPIRGGVREKVFVKVTGYAMSHGLAMSHPLKYDVVNDLFSYGREWRIYDTHSGLPLLGNAYQDENTPAREMIAVRKRVAKCFSRLAGIRTATTPAPRELDDLAQVTTKLKAWPYKAIKAEKIPANVAALIRDVDDAAAIAPKKRDADIAAAANTPENRDWRDAFCYQHFTHGRTTFKVRDTAENLAAFRKKVLQNRSAF